MIAQIKLLLHARLMAIIINFSMPVWDNLQRLLQSVTIIHWKILSINEDSIIRESPWK